MTNFSNGSDLKEREKRIFQLLEEVPLGIISFNAKGIIDFVNPAFSKLGIIYRLKASTLIGKNIFENEIIPGISLKNELSELIEGYPFQKEIKNLKINSDSEISIIIKGSPITENENFIGGILVLEDLKIITASREDDFLKLESFNRITNDVADLFFVIDNEGIIKYSTGKKLHLLSTGALINKNINEIISSLPSDFKEILADARAKGDEKRIITGIDLDGEHLFYEFIISPLQTAHKPSKLLTCTLINISDKIRSEKLEDRLHLLETVTDVLSDGVIGVDSEGIITLWSSAVRSLTGFSSEETIGKPLWSYIPVFNRQSFVQLKEDLQQLHLFKRQILISCFQGNNIITEASFLLGDANNIFISLSSTSREEKQKEFEVQDENFKSFVTKADEIVLRLNNAGIVEYLNPAFNSHLYFRDDEVIGKNINEFVDPEGSIDLDKYKDKPYNCEITLLNKRGEKNYFIANITPLYDQEELYGFNLYLIDLSEKKQKEKDLQLFRFLFENTRDGMAIEKMGKIISANNAFVKLFGYSSGNELAGKDILDLVATNDILKVVEYIQIYQRTKEVSSRLEFNGKKRDGGTFFSELTLSSFEFEGNRYITLICQDITERKQAQQLIRESEEKYRNLIENIDDFLYTLERGKIFFKPVFYTNSIKKVTGYSQAEMLNDLKFLLRIIHPDDFAYVKENLKGLIKSRTKMSAELEFRIINKQGNVVWVRNKLNITRDIKGEALKIYGLVSDITLRKKAEADLNKSTQNLLKLNETKDRFISIVSHDLRTPFSSILGFTDLLLNDDTLTEEERNQYVKYIQESSGAMLQLVNSLLDWTRLQTGRIRFEPERITAYEIIVRSIHSLEGTALQKNIKLTSTVPENIFVYVDRSLIGQVFNNLISNAIKFTKENGSITISASPSSLSRFYEFSVKDTGIGIPPGDAKKLFGLDTKFTTEGTAGEKGTGLGLSLVKEIIEKHGGTIRVESEPGVGTNLIFTLPVAAANILLVDENPTDRILYSKILKHITPDYEIDTAVNGREALNKIFSSTYALIVTEHKMQEMGGYELVLELKKADMKVKPPVIILSSSIDRQTTEEYHEIGVEQVFQKPVNLNNFKQVVEKSLRQGLK